VAAACLGARAWGTRGRERRGQGRLTARAAAPGGSGGRLGARAAAPGGGGDGGDSDVRAFSACRHFKLRQMREGKRSAGGFEAQVYSSVTGLIDEYTWAMPRGPCHVYSSVNR
jgi:hypothetical protein